MDDLSVDIVWVGHKAVLRGELISLDTKLKRERQTDFQKVLSALQLAELGYKHSGDSEALTKLTEIRELFLRLLDRQMRRNLRYMSHAYYEHGNKCGCMLARALHKR